MDESHEIIDETHDNFEPEMEESDQVDLNVTVNDKIKPEVLNLVNRFGNQFYANGITKSKCKNIFSKQNEPDMYEANVNNEYVKEVDVDAALLTYTTNLEKNHLKLDYDTYGMNDPNSNTDHPPVNNMSIFASTVNSSFGVIITYDLDQTKALHNSKEWLQIPFVVLSNQLVINANGSVQISGLQPTSVSSCQCFITCRCQSVSKDDQSQSNNNQSKSLNFKIMMDGLLKLKTYEEVVASMNETAVFQELIDNVEISQRQNTLNFFADYINCVAHCSIIANDKKAVFRNKDRARKEFNKTRVET